MNPINSTVIKDNCLNTVAHRANLRRELISILSSGECVSKQIDASTPYISCFKSLFAKWKENTSTSPSVKYLGHYKALLSPAFTDNQELINPANRIIDVHVALLNITATYGSPLERWQQIVSVMIEKKAGNYQLNKLRTIHLFEADYN